MAVGGRVQVAHKHEALVRQFPEYERQIRELAAANRDFDELATSYVGLRRRIHALEASGDVGPDYTNLCDRRDSLQETLVIMIQEGSGT
jgi:uncharacterized protein YdcH (DUF465 family)